MGNQVSEARENQPYTEPYLDGTAAFQLRAISLPFPSEEHFAPSSPSAFIWEPADVRVFIQDLKHQILHIGTSVYWHSHGHLGDLQRLPPDSWVCDLQSAHWSIPAFVGPS